MPSIESVVVRVVADVSGSLAQRVDELVEPVDFSLPDDTEQLLDALGTDAGKLLDYLNSPDFSVIAAQLRIDSSLADAAEEQVRHGLRLAGLPERFLGETARIVRQVLVISCREAVSSFDRHSSRINRQDLSAAAVANSRMLARLESLTRFHTFASRMRKQIVALHDKIRLPHIGVSRAVRYDQLYVRPNLDVEDVRLGAPGDRSVILGDPGAGKSTFAAKLAHDIASGDSQQVPFLVVLREFVDTLGQGGHDLLHYLEMLCRAPYNVKTPPDAVEYLLRSGRSVVILDGLDEIVQTELRRRVVALVEGFAHLYPLVPIVVTARRIGYDDVPLASDLFATTQILKFIDTQVDTYVRSWFALDEAASPAERKQLASSFIADSVHIKELRTNPLLLALLCAMYSSDRYLPSNLAQVYERCALMLFEQWDARRGVPLPLKFQGRLRGAVQHLAWNMFTAPKSGQPQPRSRIVGTLTRYLEDKLDDHDESLAAAEQFLAFCTGRAWILTDVGATESEPRFGFTHRTFLEYFAAEYLVRTHRTAKELWATLLPNIDQWDVVGQITLQLYDRNVEGGADELLAAALSSGGLDFAARSLAYSHPSSRTIRAITEKALTKAVRVSPFERIYIGDSEREYPTDAALYTCMHRCSPANLSVIEEEIRSNFEILLNSSNPGAIAILPAIAFKVASGSQDRWNEIQDDLTIRYKSTITKEALNAIWGVASFREDGKNLSELIRRCGIVPLYLNFRYHKFTLSSVGSSLLGNHSGKYRVPSDDLLAVTMTEQPTPWASADNFDGDNIDIYHWTKCIDNFRAMLSLPILELIADKKQRTQLTAFYDRLMRGRRATNSRRGTIRWIDQADLAPEVKEYLTKWVRRELSVVGPSPEPQSQLPVPR
ncbi:NACHT domain-containing protein [Lentzea fradiae]|uniref:NACHT domain-containing protein n=1 Tax=Lentzea fradiae TaxID=200378 RepID=A0A1G8BT57_9PSEU|nr:NACHT domain-containing protein [Lentzea fradiae]SDH36278.1 NACHT domain-containing protein [Lentzea fradiae]